MATNSIEINLGFAKLVVEQGDPMFKDVCIGLIGPKGDYQDIAIIGQDYKYNPNTNMPAPIFNDAVKVRLWDDETEEDFQKEFIIPLADEFK